MAVLDIDKILGNCRNHVYKVGVELEGGWVNPKRELVRDGSVFKINENGDGIDAGGLRRVGYEGIAFGEIPIGPMLPRSVSNAMKEFWPDKIDKSCGLHVHMSFRTANEYALLADTEDYQDTIVEYLSRWAKENLDKGHHIWPRLRNQNEYCQKKFWPVDQMTQNRKDYDHHREGHRYTMVHYCWGRTKTVECRLLPMMNPIEMSISAVHEVIKITNASLIVLAKKAEKLQIKSSIKKDLNQKGLKVNLRLRRGEIVEEQHEEE